MKIHCDRCDRILGTYLYGKGGVEEVAIITSARIGWLILPDVVCKEGCYKSVRNLTRTYEQPKQINNPINEYIITIVLSILFLTACSEPMTAEELVNCAKAQMTANILEAENCNYLGLNIRATEYGTCGINHVYCSNKKP